MKIAVEGCAHGELDKIYDAVQCLQRKHNIKVDLLIICGDFQAVRNVSDLKCMAVPPQFRKLNTFYKYYSGEKIAPILTIFIGGNHEASNYLSELPYGGWVCPNIYYLGYANVINIGGLRIAGLSGIYNPRDYSKGRFECPPYDESTIKSVYHVRNLDVFRLKQIKKPIDIFISHDWPRGIYHYGNKEDILRWKSFFKSEMSNNSLGSKPSEELLMKLKPSYWFAAHLHCKFAAIVPHNADGNKTFTKFIALDKCLPRRNFLQVLDIQTNTDSLQIEYDVEWLSILRLTNHLLSTSRSKNKMPDECSEIFDFTPSTKEMKNVHQAFDGNFQVPKYFSKTAPIHGHVHAHHQEVTPYRNPQTEKFCKILYVTDTLFVALNNANESINVSDISATDLDISLSTTASFNPDEIQLSDDSIDTVETSTTDLDVSRGADFFIDKIGSNATWNSASQVCSTPKSPALDFSFPDIKEENSKRSSEALSQSVKCDENILKKFKRRNYSLYKSEEDNL